MDEAQGTQNGGKAYAGTDHQNQSTRPVVEQGVKIGRGFDRYDGASGFQRADRGLGEGDADAQQEGDGQHGGQG